MDIAHVFDMLKTSSVRSRLVGGVVRYMLQLYKATIDICQLATLPIVHFSSFTHVRHF